MSLSFALGRSFAKLATKPPMSFATCSAMHAPPWQGPRPSSGPSAADAGPCSACPGTMFDMLAFRPSTSGRPASSVRYPSMWSNDLFSSISTTMWSIFRRFASSGSGAAGTGARLRLATVRRGREHCRLPPSAVLLRPSSPSRARPGLAASAGRRTPSSSSWSSTRNVASGSSAGARPGPWPFGRATVAADNG